MDNWMIEYKELILKGEKRAARELVLAEIPDDNYIQILQMNKSRF